MTTGYSRLLLIIMVGVWRGSGGMPPMTPDTWAVSGRAPATTQRSDVSFHPRSSICSKYLTAKLGSKASIWALPFTRLYTFSPFSIKGTAPPVQLISNDWLSLEAPRPPPCCKVRVFVVRSVGMAPSEAILDNESLVWGSSPYWQSNKGSEGRIGGV